MDIPSRDKNGNSGTPTLADGRIQEVATSAHDAVKYAAEMSHQAVDSAAAAVKPAEMWINEKSEALMATQRTALANTRQYVVTHPLQSVCIALAAGLLIGRLRS